MKQDRWLIGIVIVVCVVIWTAMSAWSVTVPVKVNLKGAFGGTVSQVVIQTRAFGVLQGTPDVLTNIDSLDRTYSLGSDTMWQVVLLITPNTGDSLVSWVFQNDFRFSSGAQSWYVPAYWGFPVDSSVCRLYVNGSGGRVDARSSAYQSYDTSFSVTPYSQYTVYFDLYEPGSADPIPWAWTMWHDTTGGGGSTTPPAANLCAVTGTVQSTDGTYIPYADVTFELPERVYDSCTGAFLAIRSVSTRTDATGRFTKNLVKSTCLGGTRYKMYVRKGGNTMVERIITVPDASTYTVTFQ